MTTYREQWIANIEDAQRKLEVAKATITSILRNGDVTWIDSIADLLNEAQSYRSDIENSYALIGMATVQAEREAGQERLRMLERVAQVQAEVDAKHGSSGPLDAAGGVRGD